MAADFLGYAEIVTQQLLQESRRDEVQIGLLQSAGRSHGLQGQDLVEFIVFVAMRLMQNEVQPVDYVDGVGWLPWSGTLEEKQMRLRLLQDRSTDDGCALWFQQSPSKRDSH